MESNKTECFLPPFKTDLRIIIEWGPNIQDGPSILSTLASILNLIGDLAANVWLFLHNMSHHNSRVSGGRVDQMKKKIKIVTYRPWHGYSIVQGVSQKSVHSRENQTLGTSYSETTDKLDLKLWQQGVLMRTPCCQSLRSNRLVVSESEYEVPKFWVAHWGFLSWISGCHMCYTTGCPWKSFPL